MDCHTFRELHLLYLDDALGEQELVAAQRHLAECPACSAHDTAVRRSLMLFRNLPPVAPSADFQARLQARLLRERARPERPPQHAPSVGLLAATLAAVVVGAGMVAARAATEPEPTLPPVVATQPAEPQLLPESLFVPAPGVLSAATAGLPVLPAALMGMRERGLGPMEGGFHLANITTFQR